MLRFGASSLKRHMLLSNWESLVTTLESTAGYVSVAERQTCTKAKLAIHSQNRSGKVKKKFSGLAKQLKLSQFLGCL